MSEILIPGTVIAVGDITKLNDFEDVFAHHVEPNYDSDLWISRTPIHEELRPKVGKKPFNGRIHDVELTVMADPYDRLMDARERGFTFSRNVGRLERTSELGLQTREQYLGLSLRGLLTSTGRGVIDEMEAEVWYAPLARTVRMKAGTPMTRYNVAKDGSKVATNYLTQKDYVGTKKSLYGIALNRFVTVPRTDRERLLRADDEARKIGFEVLKQQMRNPISAPMR